MTKLLKRIQELPKEEKPKIFCAICQYPILQDKENEALWWCPICENWVTPRKRFGKSSAILGGRGSTGSIGKLIDRCMMQTRKEIQLTIKTYTAEEYDQEFLLSLIPKRE